MSPGRDPSTTRRHLLASGAAVGLTTVAGCLDVLPGINDEEPAWERPPDDADQYEVETVLDGLAHPWGLAFDPGGDRLLVTEREGRLLAVDPEIGDRQSVDGVPDVLAEGQGGLLDVALHPEYPDEPWVYLTYAAETDGGSTTHLGRGRLDPDGDELEEFEELRAARPAADSDGHFGSRIVFGPDEMLYMTVGDRQFKDFGPAHVSQDMRAELGSVLRLSPDGSVPSDNPFVGDPDAIDSLFSFGHRNPQGLAVHPETGDVWESEHGEEDGDELNVLEAGSNYGWPVVDSACEYGTDEPVGDDPDDREDVIPPVYEWPCSTGGFPPDGMAFYDGNAFPEWQGDLLLCNLAAGYLCRFSVDGTDVEAVGTMLTSEEWRLRDVAIGPETGAIYVAVDDENAPLVRLIPEPA